MRKYKVLLVKNGRLYSPYRYLYYGRIDEVLGTKMVCDKFDESDEPCARGFYAVDINGVIYALHADESSAVFEVEVGGKSKIFNEYKQRYEEQTIIRRVPDDELRALIKAQSDNMSWNYYNACFPVDPFEIDVPLDKEKAKALLIEWVLTDVSTANSLRTRVMESVRASIEDVVGFQAWNSIWNSVKSQTKKFVAYRIIASIVAEDGVSVSTKAVTDAYDEVCDKEDDLIWNSLDGAIAAYVSSLFPDIEEWKCVFYRKGKNPFQPTIDLWHMGLMPSFDGKMWRLHKGRDAEVVLKMPGSMMYRRLWDGEIQR